VRRAARRDETEAPIVRDLRALGYQVYQMKLPVDLLVRNPRTGSLTILEVQGGPRSGTGVRKKVQLDFIRDWQVPIVKSLADAERALGTRML
jgi:hypothetical protein